LAWRIGDVLACWGRQRKSIITSPYTPPDSAQLCDVILLPVWLSATPRYS